MENREINGWINVDKPLGYSSAKVVAIVKKLLGAKKVGHGGTLDPLASGVLPICINKATKTTEKTMNFKKEYLFNITFGESRATGDAEGEITGKSNTIPTEKQILEILPQFTGVIKQTPPIFSAIKINGKRAYELARNDVAVELKEREVLVDELEFLGFVSDNAAQFRVKCGKGFYVRSIGADLSHALNTLGFISFLRRMSVGPFNQSNIMTIEEVKAAIISCEFEKNLLQI